MSVADRTMAAWNRRGRISDEAWVEIEAARKARDPRLKCNCGLVKDGNHVVCKTCWWQLPREVQCDLRSINPQRRRSGIRAALEFSTSVQPKSSTPPAP